MVVVFRMLTFLIRVMSIAGVLIGPRLIIREVKEMVAETFRAE